MKNTTCYLAAGLLALLSCGPENKSREDGGEKKTVFSYNEASGISSLDPAFARDLANIWGVNHLFNGLVQLDENLSVQPCIAKSWEVSDDGLRYTFRLRGDVYFHDDPAFGDGRGRKVVAGDFVHSFFRITDKKTASPGSWVFSNIRKDGRGDFAGFVAPDDTTLVINLARPFPPFLGLLSMPYCFVTPFEAVEKYGRDFGRRPVGTGPFRFSRWEEGVKLVLLRNDRYFETGGDGQKLPYLDAVTVSFIADKHSAFMEFLKGTFDFNSGIDASYKDELLTKTGELSDKFRGKFRMETAPYLNTEYLGFMMDFRHATGRENPLLKKEVRQAISLGFDREKMIRYLRNNIGTPGVSGFIPKGMPPYSADDVKGYGYDAERARRLLAAAGYPGGKGMPEIVLSTNGSYLDICEYLQGQLSAIGINLRLEVNPAATHRELVARSQLPFFRGSWVGDYADAENYLALFYTKNFAPSGPNYTHFSNARYDALYEKAMTEVNDSLRLMLYREMDRIIVEEAPVVVLYYDQVVRLVHNNVEDLGINPMNLLTLKKVRKVQHDAKTVRRRDP